MRLNLCMHTVYRAIISNWLAIYLDKKDSKENYIGVPAVYNATLQEIKHTILASWVPGSFETYIILQPHPEF